MKKIFSSGLMVALLLNLFGNCAFAENDADSGGSIFSDGMENLNKIYDKSDSFMVKVDTDTPDDMYRIYKTSLERQYIVYKSEKAISGYRIKAYNALGLISSMMDLYLSEDGESWVKSKYIFEEEAAKTEGWQWSYSVQKGKIPENMYYLKIEFGDGVKTWNPQISDVEIYTDGLTARPMPEENFDGTDIPYSQYKNNKEAGIIFGMGMLEDNGESLVTRAEFTHALSVLLGIEDFPEDDSLNIADLKADSRYAESVMAAVSLNIMPLYADNTFAPEEKITYEQAVRACALALGYGAVIDSKSGNGIIAGTGLTKGVGSEMNRDDAVKLLYNALNAKPMVESYGNEPKLYIDDESVLSGQLDLRKIKGQITSTVYGTLSGNQVSEGYIEIDGAVYTAEDSLIQNFLGYGVTVYINNDEEIKGYSFDKTEHTPITVNFKDAVISPESTNEGKFHYYEDDRKKSVRINPNYAEVNGEKIYSTSWREAVAGDGQITLIDSDNDGEYDTFLIEQYKFLVVKSVNAGSGIIQGKAKKILEDLDDIKYLTVIKNGKKAELADIKQNDSLTVAASKNNKYLKIYDRAAKKQGKITGISENKVFIGEGEYIVSESYQGLCGSGNYNAVPLQAGMSGTFYFSKNMEIIFYEALTETDYYAWLYGGCVKGIGNSVKLGVYTEEGEARTLYANGKVKYSEGGTKINLDGKQLLEKFSVENEVSPQLVYIKDDGSGRIISITKAAPGKDSSFFSLDYESTKASSNGGTIISGRYAVTSNTKTFSIPYDMKNIDEYSTTLNLLEGDTNENSTDMKYHVQMFDVDDMNSPSALVVLRAKNDGANQTVINKSAVMINRVGEAYDLSEDEYAPEIQIIDSKGVTSYKPAKTLKVEDDPDGNSDYSNLDRGDIVLIGLNGKGEIARISVIYKVKKSSFLAGDGAKTFHTASFGENLTTNIDYPIVYGSVNNYSSGLLFVNAGETERMFSIQSAKFYLYESGGKGGSVIPANAGELRFNDVVVVKSMRFFATEVFILR